ncbi:MAG: hypothetical protein II859_10375 [Bacteroidales bacterium]|nr:hypothetical protein [Bacteroidales bacterium]
MAKTTDNEQYYYFKMRIGKPYEIKATPIHINTVINRIYVEMTAAQQAFYLENPTATVQEVWNCALTPPYTPPAPDVAEYAARKVEELREACHSAVGVTTLEFAMAIDKVENPTASCYYGLADAQRVVSAFRAQSKAAMAVLDTYRPQIEAAASVAAVDALLAAARAALEGGAA